MINRCATHVCGCSTYHCVHFKFSTEQSQMILMPFINQRIKIVYVAVHWTENDLYIIFFKFVIVILVTKNFQLIILVKIIKQVINFYLMISMTNTHSLIIILMLFILFKLVLPLLGIMILFLKKSIVLSNFFSNPSMSIFKSRGN